LGCDHQKGHVPASVEHPEASGKRESSGDEFMKYAPIARCLDCGHCKKFGRAVPRLYKCLKTGNTLILPSTEIDPDCPLLDYVEDPFSEAQIIGG
jgi:predicted metal-binding protein